MRVRARLHVDDYDACVADYERLGFTRVKAWNGAGRSRSALFRAGPSYVEVHEQTPLVNAQRRRLPVPVEPERVTA